MRACSSFAARCASSCSLRACCASRASAASPPVLLGSVLCRSAPACLLLTPPPLFLLAFLVHLELFAVLRLEPRADSIARCSRSMTLPAAAAAGAVAFAGRLEAADDATADRDFAAADSAGGLDVVAAAVCLAAISASFRAFLSSSLRASACFAASAAWSALTLASVCLSAVGRHCRHL